MSRTEMLELPVAASTTIVLVRPHYPENVGAAARAAKTMGITRVTLVRPGRLAVPDHEMALKMAVKSWDVLEAARLTNTLEEALADVDVAFATTSRRGVSGVLQLREAAERACNLAAEGRRLAFVFGNEKTGLAEEDRALCGASLRIPMAADQPSINLAQAVQLVAYEVFMAGLSARHRATEGL
jgi:TrmH family RNA methyltransferase